jgi:hypothetical protein
MVAAPSAVIFSKVNQSLKTSKNKSGIPEHRDAAIFKAGNRINKNGIFSKSRSAIAHFYPQPFLLKTRFKERKADWISMDCRQVI